MTTNPGLQEADHAIHDADDTGGLCDGCGGHHAFGRGRCRDDEIQ
jgi:hypothetical protein